MRWLLVQGWMQLLGPYSRCFAIHFGLDATEVFTQLVASEARGLMAGSTASAT